jgi:hypothetical protein
MTVLVDDCDCPPPPPPEPDPMTVGVPELECCCSCRVTDVVTDRMDPCLPRVTPPAPEPPGVVGPTAGLAVGPAIVLVLLLLPLDEACDALRFSWRVIKGDEYAGEGPVQPPHTKFSQHSIGMEGKKNYARGISGVPLLELILPPAFTLMPPPKPVP